MPSEWAMAKAQAVEGTFNCTFSPKPLILAIATEIDAARAQGRREGLEEAAKVADAHEDHVGFEHDSQRDACVQYIAIEIRARINQEPTA